MPALPEEVSVGELVIDDIELATVSESAGASRETSTGFESSPLGRGRFRPEGAADVEAELSIGKGRSRLQGRLNIDDTGWILNASEIVANDVPLDGLPTLLGADRPWRGRLDGTGPVRLVYSPLNGAFSATTGGRWAVKGTGARASPGHGLGRKGRLEWRRVHDVHRGRGERASASTGRSGCTSSASRWARCSTSRPRSSWCRSTGRRRPSPACRCRVTLPRFAFGAGEDAFEAIDVEATNLASQLSLTIADDLGVEIDHLRSGALTVSLSADRSIEVERLELDGVVVESGSNTVSAAGRNGGTGRLARLH